MPQPAITIITAAPLPHEIEQVVRDVLDRCDPALARQARQLVIADDATEARGIAASVELAWLIAADAASARRLDDLADALARQHTPALLSAPDMAQPPGTVIDETVLAAPLGTPVNELAVLVRALLHQQRAMRPLRRQMDQLAAHHAGACQQIDRMDEELRLAAQLQREFLPARLPDMHGMQFAAMYRPAGYVSGDVYDVLLLDDEHVGLFIADAVGHGVPAALMTVLLLEAMRAHATCVDPSAPAGNRPARPDQVLAAINRTMLAQQAGRVRTATACYALLNCRTRQVMLARAGHPPAMLLEADGRMTPLQPEGSLFGVFPDPDFEVLTFRLQPGQRLLLYSDGFEVAFRGTPGSEQSQHVANPDFAEQFAMLARGPMQEALLTMAGTLDQQVGSLNQADDLTALMVGVNNAADGGTSVPVAERSAAAASVRSPHGDL